MSRAGWVLLAGGVAVLVLAAPARRSLWARLQQVPQDFRAAYAEREAQLRGALLPDDAAVAAARARRSAEPAAEDDLPYEFF